MSLNSNKKYEVIMINNYYEVMIRSLMRYKQFKSLEYGNWYKKMMD